MTSWDRYVVSRLFALFGLYALILVGVYWLNRALIIFDQMVADGRTLALFGWIVLLSLPEVVREMLPAAALVAMLQVTTRLQADSEMTVVTAAGASPWRLARGPLVFCLFVALISSVLTHALMPAAAARLERWSAAATGDISARRILAGRFLTLEPGLTLFVRAIGEDGRLADIFAQDERTPGREMTYTARAAHLVEDDAGRFRLVLIDGLAQQLERRAGRLSVVGFDNLSLELGPAAVPGAARRLSPSALPTWQLLAPTPEILLRTGEPPGRLVLTALDRLAQPLLAIVYPMLGFALLLLGRHSRTGRALQLGWAIGAVVVVYAAGASARAAVGTMPERGWLYFMPVLVGLPLVLLALARAASGPLLPRARRLPAPAPLAREGGA
ncbi:MAG: LptF/LptG family permease [Alphaproteobacteria bacterium]|nr:MAG: LptF/LptG family permease [Alphaproteobacteria bacterium]